MGRRAVPALGGARRGQDPPGARPRPRAAARRRSSARRRRLPDDAADAPVGEAAGASGCISCPTPTSCARRRTSTASRSRTRASPGVGDPLGVAVLAGDARDRRRGPPPGRRPRLGHGVPDRVRRDAPLAAAVGHAVPLRRDADPGRPPTTDGLAEPDVSYSYADAVKDGDLPAGRRSSPTTARCPGGVGRRPRSRRPSPTR